MPRPRKCTRGCNVKGCGFNGSEGLFGFPKEGELRKIWFDLCGQKEEDLKIVAPKVCYQHFTKESFYPRRPGSKQKLLLLKNAIPKLRLPPSAVLSDSVQSSLPDTPDSSSSTYSFAFDLSDLPTAQPEPIITILPETEPTPKFATTSTQTPKSSQSTEEHDHDYCKTYEKMAMEIKNLKKKLLATTMVNIHLRQKIQKYQSATAMPKTTSDKVVKSRLAGKFSDAQLDVMLNVSLHFTKSIFSQYLVHIW